MANAFIQQQSKKMVAFVLSLLLKYFLDDFVVDVFC
jgi:hypothetical protein